MKKQYPSVKVMNEMINDEKKIDIIVPSSSSRTPFNMNVHMDPNIGSRIDS